MRRTVVPPRAGWRERVAAQGLVWHTWRDGDRVHTYWGEGACYELAPAEADAIVAATRELHGLALQAVEHVVANRRYAELGLGELAIELVERSWRAREPSLYGRMDFAFGDGVPKLLEYNADTPTSLLEGGVIQWTWLADCRPDADQANAIHDALIAAWRALAPVVGDTVHFGFVANPEHEDEMTVSYLRDTAEQAGLRTAAFEMTELGWDDARAHLVDASGAPIHALFKLYPWEGLVVDQLAHVLPAAGVRWLEPAWKMVLSNKAILPILWELFPGHPNLLPAAREPLPCAWVRKPLLGREGNNITISTAAGTVATDGPYDDAGFVYQAFADLGSFDGMHPVIGSWIIGDTAAGLGIRETEGLVTTNVARFVPHLVS